MSASGIENPNWSEPIQSHQAAAPIVPMTEIIYAFALGQLWLYTMWLVHKDLNSYQTSSANFPLTFNMLGVYYGSVIATIVGVGTAVTSISDAQMNSWLNAGGTDLANAYAPIWFFGQAMNQPPCIPTWAFGGTPNSPDVYDAAHKTPPAPQCQYPNVGCNCRNPGVAIGNPTPPFPIYYTYQKCTSSEVRVAYNLFYQKDGAQVGSIATGHDYDWERVIIVHNKSSSTSQWSPAQLVLSQHSGYGRTNWADIQNTLTTAQVQAGDAKDPNGVRNNDHPKVYVAWSKHALYQTRNTGYNDPISQSTGNAFRSQDWWYYVDPKYYIRSDRSTAAGQALGSTGWGDATSNPPSVQDSLCSQ